MSGETTIVVGAGVFGLAGAIELARRGATVELFEAGSIPNPFAASADISKVARLEYGADEPYMAWMETTLERWRDWNQDCIAVDRRPLFHETGVLMVSRRPMAPDGFEYESFRLLKARGHEPERLGGRALVERFPSWQSSFEDGFYHRLGGWVEASRVVSFLADKARAEGVVVHENRPVAQLMWVGDRVSGVQARDGQRVEANRVLLSNGSWISQLLPELDACFRQTYHPVWHLRPNDPGRFEGERFPVFTADIANTGFYGFPFHPAEGVLKMAHHGEAVAPLEDGSLVVSDGLTAKFREFLSEYFPVLLDAEIVATRLCPYCDTQDQHFWITADTGQPGLFIASGGSGHGLKFAPVLGELVADAVEQRPNPLLDRFAWRPELRLDRGFEATRCHRATLA